MADMKSDEMKQSERSDIAVAIAWCLAWGGERKPQVDREVLNQMRDAMHGNGKIPDAVQVYVDQAQQLDVLPYPQKLDELKAIADENPELWNSKIGLVYGGATKIKQYVFEASKLPDIRGASALLDRINLVDLPAFFHGERSDRFEQCQQIPDYCQQVRENWLDQNGNYPGLSNALIPELIIYSTGGNILSFCPPAFVNDLADAIEKRYTEETLTANSCAVGATFRPLEVRFGLLRENIDETRWLDWFLENQTDPLVKAYYTQPETKPEDAFKQRKSFNELAGKLASLFNQRRNGNHVGDRSTTRRYPVMFETHPYLVRDESDRRSATCRARLPGEPWFSEALARKRVVGQKAKRDVQNTQWYESCKFTWKPGDFQSWVSRFEAFLENENLTSTYNPDHITLENAHKEARSLRELGTVSHPKGFVAYIYADGNNMGGYIQQIETPQEYQQFSEDIFVATEQSVYKALAKHLKPRKLDGLNDPDNERRNGKWIHPFEILTIGGDDVMLIVPADQALAIAQTIGEEFEKILLSKGDRYRITDSSKLQKSTTCHRYKGAPAKASSCKLSMSTGMLITAEDTPIYYAQDLANQLLKSAKKKAKDLKAHKDYQYYGGTIDFLVMKSVTMISSSINEFRKQGLTKYISVGQKNNQHTLKLYAAPYTLHEISGVLKTLDALKQAEFPRSQLYQIRSFLEQGKNTAILNYRYFRCRLKQGQAELQHSFEDGWCEAKTNGGNLAPWMSLLEGDKTTYETLWRELVDLYPFIQDEVEPKTPNTAEVTHD